MLQAGEGLEEGVLKQLAGHVTAGCQIAEEMLTPPSACHHMLPLVVMEHSALLPEQAALWQSVIQVTSRDPGPKVQHRCYRQCASMFL